MLVKTRMNPEPITVGPDDTLADALRLTRAHRVRHLPVVVGDGELAGILSDRDIRLAMPSPLTTADAERTDFLNATAIAAVMTRDVITVSPHETIEEAAKRFFSHRIGSLPVVDGSGRLCGIITETDILHAFVELLGGAEPASRIEIGLPDRPGELGRALAVLGETLQLNIVSVVVPSLKARARKTAVVHLATIDPLAAIEALEGAGYEVGWPSLEYDLRAPAGE